MNGCLSCVIIGCIGRMRLPCIPMRSPSTIPTTPPLTPLIWRRATRSERYVCTVNPQHTLFSLLKVEIPILSAVCTLMKIVILSAAFITKAACYWTDLWFSLLLQCVPIRRQSTVHSAAAFPLNCNSQSKVAAWLQSSEDMDKCSKGEATKLSCDLWSILTPSSIGCSSLLCDVHFVPWFLR